MYEKLKKCVGKTVELQVHMNGLSVSLVGTMRRVGNDFYLVEAGSASAGFRYKKVRSIDVEERGGDLPTTIRVG